MARFRGEDPNTILALVCQVEQDSPVVAGCEGSHMTERLAYFHDISWLRIDRGSQNVSGLQGWKSALRALLKGRIRTTASQLYRRRKAIARTSSKATWVRVKNNVLVLYPDLGIVCKIRRPNSFREAESLQREYVTLSKVSEFHGLNAPEPVAYRNDPAPALWIQYIDGREVKQNEKLSIACKIAESLLSWYEYCGVQKISAGAYPQLVNALNHGVASLQEEGWTEPEAILIHSALSRAVDAELPLLQSRIHGDASTGNAMITSNGNLIITDWESSRNDVLAHDIFRLVTTAPEVSQIYSHWREKYLGAFADPTHELNLITVLEGLPLKLMRAYFSEFTHHTEEQCAARIHRLRCSVLAACERLLKDHC